MEVACQGGQRGNVLHMRLPVQNGLIQVGNAPPLGNVEVQYLAELGGCFAGDGVAPGAEWCQLVAVLVKGEIAVHHGGYADCSNLRQRDAVFFQHILLQLGVAVLNACGHRLHGVGPDAVCQLILPFVSAGGNGNVVFVNENCLDAGRAKLNAQSGVFQIHGFSSLYACPPASGCFFYILPWCAGKSNLLCCDSISLFGLFWRE